MTRRKRLSLLLAAGAALALTTVACGKDEPPPPPRVAPPAASAAAKPATPAARRFSVEQSGTASFLIDAPLEKIKGTATRLRGHLQIDPSNLKATRGQIDVDLGTLTTSVWDDPKKNAMQSEHARNWLGLGNDVAPKERAENQWARFTIGSVKEASAADLAQAKSEGGKTTVDVTAEGELWLHGVKAPKTVRLQVTFEGPATAPTRLAVKTLEPLSVSLKEHDVKPRDLAGKFLEGALERVGKKIVDQVQISLDLSASQDKK